MCRVNVTDLRKNISHYIDLCSKEDVQIIKNGKTVAVLISPDDQYYRALMNLCGAAKADIGDKDYKDIIGEEILRKCGF